MVINGMMLQDPATSSCEGWCLFANNAPTVDAKNSLPSDLESPDQSVVEKTVVILHDESTLRKQ